MWTLCRKDQRFHLWSPWNASTVRGERQCQPASFTARFYSTGRWKSGGRRLLVCAVLPPHGCTWAVEEVRRKGGGRRLLACAFVLPPHGWNWAVRECLWLMQWEGVAFSLLFIVLTVEIACAAFHAVEMAVHSVCACGIVSCSPPPVCLPTPALLQYSVRVNVCVCVPTPALLQYSVRVNVCM